MSKPGPSPTHTIQVKWLSKEDWNEQQPEPYLKPDNQWHVGKFKYQITGLNKHVDYAIGLVFRTIPDEVYERVYNDDRTSFVFERVVDGKIKEGKASVMSEEWKSGSYWNGEVDFDNISLLEDEINRMDKLLLGAGWKVEVGVRIQRKNVNNSQIVHDVHTIIPGQVFIVCQNEYRKQWKRFERDSGSEQASSSQQADDDVLDESLEEQTDSDQDKLQLGSYLKYAFKEHMTEPDTSSAIKVEWLSAKRWKEREPSHIELIGRPDLENFYYKITGLEESAMYSVSLVFEPNLKSKYRRDPYQGGQFGFHEWNDTSSKINKVTQYFKHKDKTVTGKQWMEKDFNFDHMKFKKNMRKGMLVFARQNEICLGSGWKYKVGMRIMKEGVEEALYEFSIVPEQCFIACARKKQSSGGKRKPGGDGNDANEPSTSKKRFAPGVQKEGPVDVSAQ